MSKPIVQELLRIKTLLTCSKNTIFAQECGQLVKEAADEIERLQTRIEELEAIVPEPHSAPAS